jgi:hypothetical protein
MVPWLLPPLPPQLQLPLDAPSNIVLKSSDDSRTWSKLAGTSSAKR